MLTNAPIGARKKCYFPPFLEIMTDRPTNQQTGMGQREIKLPKFCLNTYNPAAEYLQTLLCFKSYTQAFFAAIALKRKSSQYRTKEVMYYLVYSGRMLLLVWAVCATILVFAFSCNLRCAINFISTQSDGQTKQSVRDSFVSDTPFRSSLLKPVYEAPIDSSEDIIKNNRVDKGCFENIARSEG